MSSDLVAHFSCSIKFIFLWAWRLSGGCGTTPLSQLRVYGVVLVTGGSRIKSHEWSNCEQTQKWLHMLKLWVLRKIILREKKLLNTRDPCLRIHCLS